MKLIAGVDEAGRGPLAGPVIAAAVILNPKKPIEGLADSKQLTALQREKLFVAVREHAIAYAFARATVREINELNILHASLLAMQRAVERLAISPEHVLIDGKHAPSLPYPVQTIIGGDALEPAISAASIVAKVVRDRLMRVLHRYYPDYGFAKHKGYPTQDHFNALALYGPSRVHRIHFKPVREAMMSE